MGGRRSVVLELPPPVPLVVDDVRGEGVEVREVVRMAGHAEGEPTLGRGVTEEDLGQRRPSLDPAVEGLEHGRNAVIPCSGEHRRAALDDHDGPTAALRHSLDEGDVAQGEEQRGAITALGKPGGILRGQGVRDVDLRRGRHELGEHSHIRRFIRTGEQGAELGHVV